MKEYSLFADILDYPAPFAIERIDELLPLIAAVDGKAGEYLGRFREFVAETTTAKQEELYTSTFDLQPLCYPYLGYQLFGEEFKPAQVVRHHGVKFGLEAVYGEAA